MKKMQDTKNTAVKIQEHSFTIMQKCTLCIINTSYRNLIKYKYNKQVSFILSTVKLPLDYMVRFDGYYHVLWWNRSQMKRM